MHKQYQQLTLFATCLVIFSLSFYLLLKPGLPYGHDIYAHATYLHLFDSALRQGQFPVRWVEWVQDGHSQPLFNFYQVGFYYLASLVHLFIPSLTESLKSTVVLTWWLGALFSYLLLKRFGTLAGCMGAIFFALSPYIILDIFVRAALPEFLAISLSMGLLWILDRVFSQRSVKHLLWLPLLLSMILISHLPTFVIFLPIFGLYSLFLIKVEKKVDFKFALGVFLLGLLGVGMASFYLLPALLELDLIQIKQVTSGVYDFHRHFVYPKQWVTYLWGYGDSVEGLNDGMSFQIGLSQWAIIILSLLITIYFYFKRLIKRSVLYLTFWIWALVFALFMNNPDSAWVWENLPFLSFIQFPWRYFMVIVVSVAVLSGLLLSLIRGAIRQSALVLVAISIQFLIYQAYLYPAFFIPPKDINIDNPNWRLEETSGKNAFIERGYNPTGVTRLPTTEIGRASITQGQGTLKMLEQKDHQMVFEISAQTKIKLTINSHFFPGWKVWVNGQEAEVISPGDYRYMDISLPPGQHKVEAQFTNTPIRTQANIISLVSLATWLLGLIIFQIWQNKKRG